MWLVAERSVDFQMTIHRTELSEATGAERTLVRLMPRVRAHVIIERRLLDESAPAYLAWVRPLVGVRYLVLS